MWLFLQGHARTQGSQPASSSSVRTNDKRARAQHNCNERQLPCATPSPSQITTHSAAVTTTVGVCCFFFDEKTVCSQAETCSVQRGSYRPQPDAVPSSRASKALGTRYYRVAVHVPPQQPTERTKEHKIDLLQWTHSIKEPNCFLPPPQFLHKGGWRAFGQVKARFSCNLNVYA